MATRPVFYPADTMPWYGMEDVDFDYNAGLAPAQKKKNVQALQEGYRKQHPEAKVLEVSTKSDCEAGQAASPFHLKLRLDSLHKDFPVENIYQASKVFEFGGPYVDLLGTTPLEAKRDVRLKSSGKLVHYQLEGEKYPTEPALLFYVWMYIKALKSHPELAQKILQYDAYTDIEFNPQNLNCQAKACAVFKGLKKNGLLDKADDFESFKKLFMKEDITEIQEQTAPTKEIAPIRRPEKPKVTVFKVGDWIVHPSIGEGEIMRKDSHSYTVNFDIFGPRVLSRNYVETKCRRL